jgi:hypothetical protein
MDLFENKDLLLNINLKANSRYGSIDSVETRRKISLKKRGVPNNHKKNCSCPFCIGKIGKNNPMHGKKHSDETKRKIAEKAKKRKKTLETIKKHRFAASKEKNPKYKDGRTFTDYFCILCKKKITYGNWFNGSKKCYLCYRKTTMAYNKQVKINLLPKKKNFRFKLKNIL